MGRTFEPREGDGALFVNERKEAEQQPDYTGTLFLGGQHYQIAGWKKSSKAGKKYLSLSVKPRQEQRRSEPTPQPSPADDFDDSDKLPF